MERVVDERDWVDIGILCYLTPFDADMWEDGMTVERKGKRDCLEVGETLV